MNEMNRRYQVNVRLEQSLIEEIDRLAREDAIDRSEMARRLLSHGLETRRMRRALDAYRAGAVTAWRAAEVAGVSLYEMIDRLHEEGIPHELDPVVLDRLDAQVSRPAAVHEARAPYGDPAPAEGSSTADEATGIAELRAQSRPRSVSTLFVGESSPAGGTHFYRADSNLFRATREAFVQAFGDAAIPDGPRFLRTFQDRGCWLVDLVDRPVNRLADNAREALVEAGVSALARVISETEPDHVVAVKATIEEPVQRALTLAGVEADLLALPFPVRRWRAVYVHELAAALGRWYVPGESDRAR
jgi:predicted HTH domain antitoxin